MATTTTHYGLVKPGVNDYVDISVINANYDNLDNVIYNNLISALENLAPEYDATATYSVGDYVTYNKTLYRCITAIATAEAFDATKWTAVKVGGELKSHNTRISDLEAGVELEGEATNSFDDGIDSYFKKVVSTIVPVQAGSGTPSPTNVRAISGFTECVVKNFGKNLCSIASFTMGGASAVAEGIFKANTYAISFDTTTAGVNISAQFRNADNTATIVQSGLRTASGRNTIVINLGEDTTKFRFFSDAAITITNTQIEVGSTATAYEPYEASTATIQFGAAGTVYDATVDLISGKLVVEWGYLAPTEIVQINQSGTTYYWLVSSAINSVNGGEGSVKSSHFKSEFGASAGNTYITGNGHALMAVPTDQSLNTKALADAWLQANNPQFIYKLATPQEYQLTPAQLRSLIGANRLTSSTGEVTEVEYIKNKTIAWLLDLIRA